MSDSESQTSNTKPEEQKKKKFPTWAKVIIVLFSLMIVAELVALILVPILLKDNDKEVQQFLTAIYKEDYDAAYDYFAPELQKDYPPYVFETGLSYMSLDDTCKTTWTTSSLSSSTSKGSVKEIAGTIECEDATYTAEFELRKQGDEYKIWKYSIEP
ncbi:hypothetical protein FWF74_02360 [Candidatus Saccharibacteria bacterium]|nr:hypothetical protein [Candidatus Saccharibacteria bacterium]MCL1962955.1 hypothetical protein [Candidatus Saccharibacteria bacterium]